MSFSFKAESLAPKKEKKKNSNLLQPCKRPSIWSNYFSLPPRGSLCTAQQPSHSWGQQGNATLEFHCFALRGRGALSAEGTLNQSQGDSHRQGPGSGASTGHGECFPLLSNPRQARSDPWLVMVHGSDPWGQPGAVRCPPTGWVQPREGPLKKLCLKDTANGARKSADEGWFYHSLEPETIKIKLGRKAWKENYFQIQENLFPMLFLEKPPGYKNPSLCFW